MSTQVTIRLSHDLVEFVDGLVASGAVSSRTAVVIRAIERERRGAVAERDVRILVNTRPDPELEGLV